MSLNSSPGHTLPPCIWVAIVVGVFSLWWPTGVMGQVDSEALAVSITTQPSASAIRPDLDLVHVTLSVEHHGQPLRQGHIFVKVLAPPRPSILSTDFPIVEETTLLELASDLRDGALTFDYLFPIRGTYAFDVTLSPVPGAPDFATTTLRQTMQLRENPTEVRNVWLLVIGLFGLGSFFGVVFARSAAARGELPGSAILLVIVLLTSGGVATRVEASEAPGPPVAPEAAGWTLQLHPTPGQATVGHIVQLAITLTKEGAIFPHATEIAIDVYHEEDEKTIFQTTILARNGKSSQGLQFFDGAPHQVTVRARPAGTDHATMTPLKAVLHMDVIGVQPPLAVRLRTLALFIGVLIVGMLVGFVVPLRGKETEGASVR